MTQTNLCLIVSFIAVFSLSAHSDNDSADPVNHAVETGNYSVGFQLLEEQDTSRTVIGADSTSTFPRPIRTYLWYPARKTSGAKPMLFSRYAELADDDIWPAKITGKMRTELTYSRKVLARSLEPESFKKLLQQPLGVVEDAAPLDGPFPLIVIGQGLYYESPIVFSALAEFLARQGFVVVTCPLVGSNSAIVRMDIRDLETSVRDLEFVIARARRFSFVSSDQLGVFGFDMGGMAGLILTMRNADVDAFVSVSSGILYENQDGIPSDSPHHEPDALRVPWLHSVPVYWMKPADSGEQSLFDTARHSERYLLLTNGLGHVDYTSYALIPDRSPMSGYWEASNPEIEHEHKAVNNYVLNFFNAFLKQDPDSLASMEQDPKLAFEGSAMTIQHRAAVPVQITYEGFVQAVTAGEAEQAIEKVRTLKETNPDHILLSEQTLQRLVWSLRDTWGLYENVLPVIRFIVELFPQSDNAQYMLAEGLVSVGDYPAAIEAYQKILLKNPEDEYSKTRFEWLQNQ